MKTRISISALASLALIAAHHGGHMEVLRHSTISEWLGLFALLTSVTALTFIVVLLACGMREPIL